MYSDGSALKQLSRDPAHHTGWSVTAIGPSREVTDPEEIGRLQEIGLTSWAPGAREHFIRISPVMLTGRYLRADGQQLAHLAG
ncbi:MAG: pyridoxamine 5'-phosphate oxidase family protein [Streptosporangiaceae bacterium]